MQRTNSWWLGASFLLALGANAEAPAGEKWDDSHMQSRHSETRSSERPRISGESGYGALLNGSAGTSKTVKPELEYTSQREWVQGNLSTSSKNHSAREATSTKSGDSSGISRGSKIRGQATSSRRRRG
jgi:hypothetical protein